MVGNVERINHELLTEQQDMMAQVGNGREQQHGAEHQLENSGGERSDPLVTGSVRLQGLVELAMGASSSMVPSTSSKIPEASGAIHL